MMLVESGKCNGVVVSATEERGLGRFHVYQSVT